MTDEREDDKLEITLHANPMHSQQEIERIKRARIIALLEQWGKRDPVDDEEEDELLTSLLSRSRERSSQEEETPVVLSSPTPTPPPEGV